MPPVLCQKTMSAIDLYMHVYVVKHRLLPLVFGGGAPFWSTSAWMEYSLRVFVWYSTYNGWACAWVHEPGWWRDVISSWRNNSRRNLEDSIILRSILESISSSTILRRRFRSFVVVNSSPMSSCRRPVIFAVSSQTETEETHHNTATPSKERRRGRTAKDSGKEGDERELHVGRGWINVCVCVVCGVWCVLVCASQSCERKSVMWVGVNRCQVSLTWYWVLTWEFVWKSLFVWVCVGIGMCVYVRIIGCFVCVYDDVCVGWQFVSGESSFLLDNCLFESGNRRLILTIVLANLGNRS